MRWFTVSEGVSTASVEIARVFAVSAHEAIAMWDKFKRGLPVDRQRIIVL